MKRIDGLPVSNAAAPIRLTITSKDIRDGAPLNSNACAIALAATRHVAGVTAAKAHLGCIYLMIRGNWRRFKTSGALSREITAFDRGGKFWPGDYDLLPVPVSSLVKRKRPSSSNGARRHRRSKPHHTEGVRETAHRNEPARETPSHK